MNIYDPLIGQVEELTKESTRLDLSELSPWPQVEREELILKSDMAMELGGGSHQAVSGMAFTSNDKLLKESQIRILGAAGLEEGAACDYARFVLIRLNKKVEEMEAQELYANLRKLDYLRYHCFLQGVSARISSRAHREVLRISKEAKAAGLTPGTMGMRWLKAFEAIELVEAVEIIYVMGTMPRDLYQRLDVIAASCEDITESLNVIFQGVSMDCSSCGQKAVCDAVDGLRQMHEEIT